MESERTEAYRTYMSDAFAFLNTALTRGEIEIPRYADIYKPKAPQQEETAEQVISRFNKLRKG